MSNAATVEAVFFAALEKENAAERTSYLDSACGGDGDLRRQVEKLLAAHPKVGDFLKKPIAEQWARVQRLADATAADHVSTAGESALPKGNSEPRTEGGRSEADEEPPLDFLQPSTRPDSLGRIGHYEVLELLGRGGFGIVFRAFDETLQRVVAVKALAPPLAVTAPARKRFLREARSSAKVRHENVVQVYGVGEHPLPYLVMEFIPGETLQQRLNRTGPLETAEVARLGRQLAEGLAAAHDMGLIHRDIKPGNILLEASPGREPSEARVKITDFGLARAADDASVSQSGIVAGTPMFMAPEQAQGEPLDHRADLFSLGSVLYTMCTGRPPFRANTALAVLKRVSEDAPRPIREIIPEAPQWLCDIIARLHAKKPEDRFASAREVADLLGRCLAEMERSGSVPSLQIVRPSAVVRLPAPEKDPETAPTMKPVSPRNASAWRRWAGAAAVLLLLFAGLGFTEATGVTNFRGTVIRLLSAEGTLVVEVDDPGVSVTIDGSDIVITGAGAKEIRLRPGSYKIEASKDGKVVRRELVTVAQNGRQVVRVSQEATQAARTNTVELPDAKAAKSAPDTAAWERVMAVLSAEQQVKFVAARLQELNPGFDGKIEPAIESGIVTGLAFSTAQVSDISPLRVFTQLKNLTCTNGRLIDLSPLKGLPLTHLNVRGNPIHDLSPLKGMKLTFLDCRDTKTSDLSPLQDMPLTEVALDFTARRDAPILRPMKTLKTINDKPAGKFWNEVIGAIVGFRPFGDADIQRIAALPAEAQIEEVRRELKRRNPEFDGTLHPTIENGEVTRLEFSTEHLSDIWPLRALTKLRIILCPAGSWQYGKLTDLAPLRGLPLTSLSVPNNPIYDLAPLQGMKLLELDCGLTKVADLSPLQGMPLERFSCAFTRVADLSPLKGMKLIEANFEGSEVSNLAPLQGMPLKVLVCYGLKGLTDLSPLKGMALTLINLQNTGVSDLTPLKGMPLNDLNIPGNKVTDLGPIKDMRTLLRLSLGDLARLKDLSPLVGLTPIELHVESFNAERDAAVLRSLSTLKSINGKPAAQFWKEVDAGGKVR